MAANGASMLPAAANPAVAAQPMDENASAKVATREDVCRRRKWLRFACARKKSWIAVDDAAATRTPIAVTKAAHSEAVASAATIGASTKATEPMTATSFAPRHALPDETTPAGGGAIKPAGAQILPLRIRPECDPGPQQRGARH